MRAWEQLTVTTGEEDVFKDEDSGIKQDWISSNGWKYTHQKKHLLIVGGKKLTAYEFPLCARALSSNNFFIIIIILICITFEYFHNCLSEKFEISLYKNNYVCAVKFPKNVTLMKNCGNVSQDASRNLPAKLQYC